MQSTASARISLLLCVELVPFCSIDLSSSCIAAKESAATTTRGTARWLLGQLLTDCASIRCAAAATAAATAVVLLA
eukprot:2620-Heterococcus_DN1.PRE.6